MSNVKELTPDDFASKNPQKLNNTYKNKITFVKFYSPGCIHCINSQPEYEELATKLKDDAQYIIAEIDCTKYQDFMGLLQRGKSHRYGYKVDGYPTFIIFVNSLYYDTYKDGRDLNSYLNTLANIQTS
jgi:thiol-disulfide isomerase/thioredoxin